MFSATILYATAALFVYIFATTGSVVMLLIAAIAAALGTTHYRRARRAVA